MMQQQGHRNNPSVITVTFFTSLQKSWQNYSLEHGKARIA